MKNRPDQQEDFFSSAGVPTIPLRAKPPRANDSLIVYGVLAVSFLLLAVLEYLIGVGVIWAAYAALDLFIAIVGAVMIVVGFAFTQKWVVLGGLTVVASMVGLYFGALTGTVSLPLALLIMLLLYRWYLLRYHLESSAWPLMVGILCGIAGVLLLLTHLGVLVALFVPVLLMCASIGLFIWQWRSM